MSRDSTREDKDISAKSKKQSLTWCPLRPKGKGGIDGVVRRLAKQLAVEVSVLRGSDRSWAVSKARKQIAYVLVRRTGYRLKDIANYLGRDPATLATLLARMNEDITIDSQETREIERLVKIVEK